MQYRDLLVHVNATSPTSLFGPAKEGVREILHDMWEKHVVEEAVVACALLAFDEHVNSCFTAERIRTAIEWLQLFAARYALDWNSSLILQCRRSSDSRRRRSGPILPVVLKDQLLQQPRPRHHRHQSRARQGAAPIRCAQRLAPALHSRRLLIANAAVALLSISSSEAAVGTHLQRAGRCAYGQTQSARRRHLLEAEMYIKFNERTVSRVEESALCGQQQSPHVGEAAWTGRALGAGLYGNGEATADDSDDDVPCCTGHFHQAVVAAGGPADNHNVPARLPPCPTWSVDEAAPVVRAVQPEPVADPVQAFIVQYVRDNPIHGRFRWKDYQLQQLEAAGAAWQPPMRDTPDQLKKRIMAWVRSEEYRELQEEDAQEHENENENENSVVA